MMYMFQNCSSLTELDLSSFDISNVKYYSGMFDNVPTDCLIYVKDSTAKTWITSKFSTLTKVQIKEVSN
jgi:surface protein